ncbi:glycoside hydrolase family 92 protein [Chitinophaga agrisoli]|uniref:Glycoside hydrolase family 92 protein n=1 Tax=Chitinophaga agrisoli TaxID=2607653 RepID=A0A5B2VQ78_9BACT|nr:GH92 family glycosyl hydrolase [Chitinophaga agrisoli]KAA2240377.1 glycoside hydrolase family 92 protein [Chitinophaga agrisoli]
MKKWTRQLCLTSVIVLSFSLAIAQEKEPADYVNPFIGASTNVKSAGNYAGLGKTFPGAATPFGMTQVSPNTITGGDNGSGYSYEHTSIEGFALTQMSGVGWYGDLGNFLVMPGTGAVVTYPGKEGKPGGYRATYDKTSEKASAGYYTVTLSDTHIQTELTATPHCGFMRFSFPQNQQSRIQIDLARRVGGTSTRQYIKVVDDHTIEGWMKCTPAGGGWGNGDGHADYTVYFHASFSKPLKDYGVWSANIPAGWSRKRDDVLSEKYQDTVAHARILKGIQEQEGDHLGFYTSFATNEKEAVLLKTGISFVSIADAKQNLEAEIKDWNFDKVHQRAHNLWNTALSKVRISGGSEDEKVTFYTALYHTMIDPRSFQDVNGNYMGGDGKPHKADGFTKRTIFSGWDVFRSQMPLQTIINPRMVNDMVNSMVTLAEENGTHYFDRWEMMNAYSGCMVGNPVVSMVTDAFAKGIRNYDAMKAYQFSKNTVEKYGNGEKGFSGPPHSISNTLEYAYSDWCVSQLAIGVAAQLAEGKERVDSNVLIPLANDYIKYNKRSQAYKQVFDTAHHWFRPRKDDGSWEPWPAEGRMKEWYGTVECNPYQQGWFVPHDIPGMIKLMGGEEKVREDLTSFFAHTPENLLWNDYYNHANEPVHHVPFLFNRLGAPWLTQQWTRDICRRAYHNAVEGLVGNEDVGQMSAWYVLAAMGIHPICPGSTEYEITSPVFNKIVIQLDGKYAKGKTFTIIAKDNSPQNIYIQDIRLNGKGQQKINTSRDGNPAELRDKYQIDYKDIIAGGTLELQMGSKPKEDTAYLKFRI